MVCLGTALAIVAEVAAAVALPRVYARSAEVVVAGEPGSDERGTLVARVRALRRGDRRVADILQVLRRTYSVCHTLLQHLEHVRLHRRVFAVTVSDRRRIDRY